MVVSNRWLNTLASTSLMNLHRLHRRTPPPAPNKVSLSKVSLTKEKPAISLAKKDNFGEIRINLNWHRGSGSGGLLGGMFGSNKAIDLDLGAFVELQDGYKSVVQALGNAFGNYHTNLMFSCRAMIVPGRPRMANGCILMAGSGKKSVRY
jgi:hypothetical protein